MDIYAKTKFITEKCVYCRNVSKGTTENVKQILFNWQSHNSYPSTLNTNDIWTHFQLLNKFIQMRQQKSTENTKQIMNGAAETYLQVVNWFNNRHSTQHGVSVGPRDW